METIISGFVDAFPGFLRPKKTLFTFFCCFVGFLTDRHDISEILLKVVLNTIKQTIIHIDITFLVG
jgi:hypothetical protein